MKHYLGIDVGKNGGFVLIDEKGKLLDKRVNPISNGQIDFKGTWEIFRDYYFQYSNLVVIVEKLHAIFQVPPTTNFILGTQYGMVIAYCNGFDLPYHLVSPIKWQKAMFESTSPIYKKDQFTKKGKKKLDTKAMAALSVKKLFPKADFRKSTRCTKVHDGIVDAALLAEYARRNNL